MTKINGILEPSLYPTIIELPEHFIENVKQEELDFLIKPNKACSEKRSLVALIKTANYASKNRKWVREMFKTLLQADDTISISWLDTKLKKRNCFKMASHIGL